MKIIFADIDGVFNHEEFYRLRVGSELNSFWTGDEWNELFCPNSVKEFNRVTDTIPDCKVVISSTKRMISKDLRNDLSYFNKMWNRRELTSEIIGITPNFSNLPTKYNLPRGCEIDFWLKQHKYYDVFWSKDNQKEIMEFSGIDNYVIIDDDSDMLYIQRNHFVHVLPSPRSTNGFNKECADKAIEILSKTSIELNF